MSREVSFFLSESYKSTTALSLSSLAPNSAVPTSSCSHASSHAHHLHPIACSASRRSNDIAPAILILMILCLHPRIPSAFIYLRNYSLHPALLHFLTSTHSRLVFFWVCSPSLMGALVAAGSLGCIPTLLQSRHSSAVGLALPSVSLPYRHAHSWPAPLVTMAKSNWAHHAYHHVQCAIAKTPAVMLASGAAALVSMHSSSASAVSETFTITFPGSQIGEVNAVQKTLVEAWGIVRETYVDPTFNNQDWDLKLQEALGETLSAKTSEAAYAKIRSMLATLGDPFTRIVSPQEYASFRINNDGALEGVGLLIGSDRDSGRLVVLSPIEGGPAQRAGIVTGDELVQIDGVKLVGMNNEEVATRLRGRAGTSVTLKVRRAGTGSAISTASEITEITLKRETILLSPVYSVVVHHVALSGQEMKTGYVRLSSFSQNAAVDMEKAVSKLEESGVDSYILDLRNNPGGLVKAGLDVAQMWLDGNETLVNTVDRNGFTQPINLVNGHALTHDPLVVLVNEGSASASEILAGALHDNGRAVLVGTNTFGKGKIQSVTELQDGSALFVTVAKYLSPALHQIDHIGIAPDVKCMPDEVLPISSGVGTSVDPLDSDSCIITAEHQLDLH